MTFNSSVCHLPVPQASEHSQVPLVLGDVPQGCLCKCYLPHNEPGLICSSVELKKLFFSHKFEFGLYAYVWMAHNESVLIVYWLELKWWDTSKGGTKLCNFMWFGFLSSKAN